MDFDRRAILMVRPVAARELVARCCALCAAARIVEGMDLAHARSLLPPHALLHMEPHRPDRDDAALRSLAGWALRFSPLVAPDPPDGLMLDITGTEHLHGGESALLRAVSRSLRRLGFAAGAAIASTFGCAWGLSRFGSSALSRVDQGQERAALASLPTAALRIAPKIVLELREIGITTVGQVLDLPRSSLVSRFDASLVHRLMQAIGLTPEQIDPIRPAPPLRHALMFDGPTDHYESVQEAARVVLHDLVAELLRRQRGVRRLDAELLRPHAPPTLVTIHLSRPSASGRHVWTLLRSRLERVDMGQGVEGIVQTVVRSAPLRHCQQTSPALGGGSGGGGGWSDDRASEAQWGELVDTLATRLGPDKVVQIDSRQSHLPEHAFQERSAMEPRSRRGLSAKEAGGVGVGGITAADRPTILYKRPEPADAMAMTPDGPILALGWRGRRWNVLSCTGPERIGQEWWRWTPPEEAAIDDSEEQHRPRRVRRTAPLAPPDRDYFSLRTAEGRCLWVCRHVGTGRWFVHGEWS